MVTSLEQTTKKDAEQQDIEDGVLDYVHTKTQEKMEMIVHAKFDTYKDYKVKCNFTKQDTIKDKPKTNFAGKTIKRIEKIADNFVCYFFFVIIFIRTYGVSF